MEQMSKNDIYIIEDAADFFPAHIFDCGQCFRWRRQDDGSYTGIAGGRIANIAFVPYEEENAGAGGRLVIRNCTAEDFEKFWRQYLDLDRNYGKIKRKLCRGDQAMKKAVRFGWGIRILQQELWETIVSFIISQNNHIPRIKGCIENLAEMFGDEAGSFDGKTWYNLPSPERLASLTVEDLAPVKLGYRAKYLIETARVIARDGLPRNAQQLAALPGVGPKVAACILLFGMGQYEAFPIDVWMARVMHELYGFAEKDKNAMADFAADKFGKLGGFAQQYLFYYMRENG